jgi:hypothetical protein
MDLLDYKPTLEEYAGTELPGSIRMGQRITGMTSGQSTFPVARSVFKFQQYSQSRTWVSELMPYTAKIVDHFSRAPKAKSLLRGLITLGMASAPPESLIVADRQGQLRLSERP